MRNALRLLRRPPQTLLAAGLLLIALAAAAFLLTKTASASSWLGPQPQASPLHPRVPLLDEDGQPVLLSAKPVSTIATCGACHDADFIAGHSYHADAGLTDFGDPGSVPSSRPWDTSPGLFGRWDPLHYRYLSPAGDARLDLGTAAWIQLYGGRHVGGGPAVTSRAGAPLEQLPIAAKNPETHVLDPQDGEVRAWDWEASGAVEMNCFLCHTPAPDNAARLQALQEGRFAWAASATLLGTGLIEPTAEGYRWKTSSFEASGEPKEGLLAIQDPGDANCGLCHGLVQDKLEQPVSLAGCSPETYRTVTSGQIVSGQRVSDSGMNLMGKDELTRSWDVHAERGMSCTDCHYSLNNPVYDQESEASRPEHMTFDPRRLGLGEYLYQPLHEFARGQSAQGALAPELQGTMRGCESCHSLQATHDWLPYKERHVEALRCETCHISKQYANALQQIDWTVLGPEGLASTTCRGLQQDASSDSDLITGFEPALLPQADAQGATDLVPLNLVSAWYWVYGDPPRPVRLIDLQAAWFEEEAYAPQVLAAFDRDGDGVLGDNELRIDTPPKQALISGRLAALGLQDPRIVAEVIPYSINHGVAAGEWAVQDCRVCHAEDSRLTQPVLLASYQPGGVTPQLVPGSRVAFQGELYSDDGGSLYYRPDTSQQGSYVFGHDRLGWIDRLGGFTFLGVLAGVVAHGGLRFASSFRKRRAHSETDPVYMYGVYERLWHWLQTFTLVALLFTGLVIHKPDLFAVFSFRGVVLVHNILAAILVVNAALALFYHLASGEIRQFIPRPVGFFDQAIVQAKFYLRGIFQREPHPLARTPQEKLNPLQQVTYLAILNVLLPLQVISGILIWGAERWPELAGRLGGLPFLAPFHTLIAWLFAAFIVLHVYLTTTGHSPLTSLRAMTLGWDEVEAHASQEGDPS